MRRDINIFAALAEVNRLEVQIRRNREAIAKKRTKDPLLHSEFTITGLDPESSKEADRWKFNRRLGAGAFGIVYEAERRKNVSNRPNKLAVKLFVKNGKEEAEKEYTILKYLENKGLGSCVVNAYAVSNIVTRFMDSKGRISKDEENLYFVSEELMDGDLEGFWEKVYLPNYEEARKNPKREKSLIKLLNRLYDLFIGLTYCIGNIHTVGIVLRDIKPPNILYKKVKNEIHFKFSDVGLSCAMGLVFGARGELTITSVCEASGLAGTVTYFAPEIQEKHMTPVPGIEGKTVFDPVSKYLAAEKDAAFTGSDYWALGMTILQVLIANPTAYYFPPEATFSRYEIKMNKWWQRLIGDRFSKAGISTIPEINPANLKWKSNPKIKTYLDSLMNKRGFGNIALLAKALLTVDPDKRKENVDAIIAGYSGPRRRRMRTPKK